MIRIFLILLVSCVFAAPKPNSKPLHIMVSIIPQVYLVEKITKGNAIISVMVPQNKAPENYEPRPAQMKTLKEKQLFIGVGMPFEKKWEVRFRQTNPKMRFINSTQKIAESSMQESVYVWLSPKFLKIQAKEIFYAVASVDLRNKEFYKQNYEAFLHEIDLLDLQIKKIFAQQDSKKGFVLTHSSLKHFARDYGLEEVVFDVINADKPEYLQELKNTLKTYGLDKIFLQPQFVKKQTLALCRKLKVECAELNVFVPDLELLLLQTAKSIAR